MQATLNGHYSNGATLVIDPNLVSPLSYINPSQILSHTAQAGSSSSDFVPPSSKRKSPANLKRKRTDTPEESGDSSSQRKNRDGPKKKKANRACFHCQKAHLTCDDSRPCQRCIKRGISTNCTEGHRKKAKYLLDDDELEQLKRKSSAPENNTEPPPIPPSESFPPADSLFQVGFDANFAAFGSEAADREYSILSAILGSPSPPDTGAAHLQYTQNIPDASWSSSSVTQHQYGQSVQLSNGYSSGYGEPQMSMQPSEANLSSPTLSTDFLALYPSPQRLNPPPEPQLQYPSQFPPQESHAPPQLHPLQPRYPNASNVTQDTPKEALSRALISPALSNHSHSSTTSAALGGSDLIVTGTPAQSTPSNCQLQNINDRVTAPYDYTEGYHFLMKHLHSRFEKNDILHIVRALAIYRPSLIALQMPLSVEDEVFVERCFQRSLLELGKLIEFSGTPTVVWRRTGEICLVAPEFMMLTEWSREELMGVGRRKYIYELLENQSVVEYWENFASHAFENTTKTVNSHCVLLKPSGGPIPCTFCFSVRRDLFDLPSLVIGQWLPLL